MLVKELMPPKDGINRKHPPAGPLGEMWYSITFSAVQKYIMLWDDFNDFDMKQKNRGCSMSVVANRTCCRQHDCTHNSNKKISI